MKKGFIKILTTGLVLSASMGLVACDTTKPEDDKVKYSFYNYDNTYDLNEVFSLEGAKLKLTKPDGTTEEITIRNSMIKEMPDMSTSGTKTIVIVYEGVEYELYIEVLAPSINDPEVVDYEFSGYKSTYIVGEEFDITNLKLFIDYDIIEDVEISVTSSMIYQMPNMSTPGNKTVGVRYNGEEFALVIKVEKPTVVSYNFTGYATSYFTGDTFNISNLKLNLEYSNDTDAEITVTAAMIDEMPDMTTAGNKEITVTYDGREYEFVIQVVEPVMTGYHFTGYSATYSVNDTFNVSNLKLVLEYNNGSEQEITVTSGMISQMPDMTTAGSRLVTVTYEQAQYQFSFQVLAPNVTSYNFTGLATSYYTGDTFDITNLMLSIEFSNGTNAEVPVTARMIDEMPDMETAGHKVVDVTYDGNIYSLSFNVTQLAVTSHNFTGLLDHYYVNDTFVTTGLKLNLSFNNGTNAEIPVTLGMISVTPDMTSAGNKNITVQYNGANYLFTITVEKPAVESHNFTGYLASYFTNDAFNISNLKLHLEFINDTSAEIPVLEGMIRQMPDMTTAGTKTVKVVYDGHEYEFSFQVKAPSVISHEFSGYNDEYQVEDEFDLTNLKLHLEYDNGDDKDISVKSAMVTQMPDMTTAGTKTVKVAYNGQEFSFNIVVKDDKAEMLATIEKFMQDYNSASVKDTGIKIKVEGTAKYLQDSAEFNELIANITMSSLNNLEGYKIYKMTVADTDEIVSYVFHKEYATWEDYIADENWIDFVGMDNYIVLQTIKDEGRTLDYGSVPLHFIENWLPDADVVEIQLDEFKDTLQLTNSYDNWKDITIFNSKLAQPIYKAIINSVVNATTSINRGDIVSAKNDLTAKLDTLKTLEKFATDITTLDYYNYIVNDLLLTEKDNVYVELARNSIADLFTITDQTTLDELDFALTNDIKKIRNNQLTDIATTYDMIVELNNIIQKSDGDATLLEQLDIIVSGIDTQDKNMLSKFVYSLRTFVSVYEYTYGETTDYEEAISGNRWYYDGYYNGSSQWVYMYREETVVSNSEDLVNDYYAGLQSFISRFENVSEYTNVKTFANDLISDLRTMDTVVQFMEENGYESDVMNFGITSTIRMGIQAYIDMYETDMISGIIAMLGQGVPEGAQIYEVISDSMAPEFWAGDKITVKTSQEYYVGDIVLYNYNQMSVAHRIIGIFEEGGKTYYICHGDNVQSANPSGAYIVDWQEDSQYINSLINEGKTKAEIESTARNIQIIEVTDIVGAVIDVNGLYLEVPQNLLDALQECSDIIYLQLGSRNPDYVKMVEDICERLGLEKEYYVEKYHAGELTIFTDAFDKFIDTTGAEGAELAFYNTMRATCEYMDTLLVQGTDRTELLNKINECAQATLDFILESAEHDEIYTVQEMVLDCIVKITNTEQDYNTNIKDIVTEYKTIIKDSLTMMITDALGVAENETAVEELDHIINYHLTAYLKNQFVVGDLVADVNDYIDTYAEQNVRTYTKSIAILSMLIANQGQDVDYNELLGSLELPDEIKEVDFNKLIKETLQDKDTYDILNVEDVKVDYITDQDGNITKEVLTITLNANYDILLSSLDAKVTMTIEINF